MVRPFEKFDQLLDLIETKSRRRLQVPRLDFEWFSRRLLRCQSEAQEMIHDLLERVPRSPRFFLEELGDIVIESQSSSHIKMLSY